MKTAMWKGLVLGLVLVVGSAAWAEITRQSSDDFANKYEGDVYPIPGYTEGGTTGTVGSDGNYLTFNFPAGDRWFEIPGWSNGGYTIETRLQVLSQTGVAGAMMIFAAPGNGSGQVTVWIGANTVKVSHGGYDQVGPTADNTDGLHTYRIIWEGGSPGIQILRDNKPIGFTVTPTGLGYADLYWGGGSGDAGGSVKVDYFRWTPEAHCPMTLRMNAGLIQPLGGDHLSLAPWGAAGFMAYTTTSGATQTHLLLDLEQVKAVDKISWQNMGTDTYGSPSHNAHQARVLVAADESAAGFNPLDPASYTVEVYNGPMLPAYDMTSNAWKTMDITNTGRRYFLIDIFANCIDNFPPQSDAAGQNIDIVAADTATIHGTVIPAGYASTDYSNVGVVLELRQGGVLKDTKKVFLNADGTFTTSNLASGPGVYDITIKGYASVAQELTGKEIFSVPSEIGTVTLTGGDADGDNHVTSTDLSIVLANLE